MQVNRVSVLKRISFFSFFSADQYSGGGKHLYEQKNNIGYI